MGIESPNTYVLGGVSIFNHHFLVSRVESPSEGHLVLMTETTQSSLG